ncbi:pimeloyl-ACP methyl ester carboxylesterase [Ancylobacter aquaticus]|uniref:Pimeloyl-ACP methyl ester carboxylesterase n=1 Tax=Ancylobacter aquaticus TaxID=100 RepID=A0A4R1HG92_ANCAQ|nr:alpha/beta fold hydrolase [Ancylobacter aquaticus]TCK19763.1 pimeloyl-ACP methyl ester carboxylesterase [Ancylobacter aquaticus]
MKHIVTITAVCVALAGPAAARDAETQATVPQMVIAATGIAPTSRPSDAGELVSAEAITHLDPVLASVAGRADRMTYRSRSLNGSPVVVSGVFLTPKGQPPKHRWPIVSWGHGSSGISDNCAPSTITNKGGKIDLYGYGSFIAELLKAGYAVVATDYEGLGTPGIHPYIIADSEGRSMIDAVRAAIHAEPALSKSWFAVGHSQGGQAAIAAGELAETWGKGLDFRGTVGLAPVTNVGAAYSYGSPGPVDRGFYLLALQGLKTQDPSLRYDDYLGSEALQMLPATANDCTMKIWEDFSANLGAKMPDFQFTPQSPAAALKLQKLLDAQSVPRGLTPAPMLLLQGDQDPSIKIAVTQQAVQNARFAGTTAQFRVYPGKDHYSVLATGAEGGAATDVVKWLNRQRLSVTPPL